ncbi:MAG: thioredoxin domain-containing protein [Acidimicrobiales bacterium]
MNRLADETSPYLRQHAGNPVDWWPWAPEAFARARLEDKPVFVSVGYSACHWCHVMAHESFEDPDTAAEMNDLFVNIKVDREERPDVDAVYMDATQAMTGQGGWPMSAFCTPEGEPFYTGTYFPKERRHGLPAFLDVCRAVADAWRDRRHDVLAQAGEVTKAVGRSIVAAASASASDELPGPDAVDRAVTTLLAQHDDDWGGFGGPPKFPQSMSIDLLLRAHRRSGAPEPLAAAEMSLDAMASGGIYDHVGGGFARYSVDGVWLVPHFEKMLYDQALLTRAYLHAWQVTGEARFRQVVEETVDYVLRDLRHRDGGLYSAEDADSEGEEGRFYVWTPDAIVDALDGDEELAASVADYWGVTAGGNFEGATILNRIGHLGDLLRPDAIEAARRRLFAARERRVRPGLDDKVLTEWNGLMLATLAEAAAATGRADWLAAAVETGEFLVDRLRRDDGRWLRSWQAQGGARHLAFAADYAAMVDAFTGLAEASGEARWIERATETADGMLDLFWDPEEGGLFTTGDDGERLIARQKDLMDNPIPSANSLAALGLLRLAALTGIERYRERAEALVRTLGPLAASHPTAFAHQLAAVDLVANGLTEIVVAGDRPDLVQAVREGWRPNAVLAWGERYDSPLWEGRDDGRAYVCRNYACRLPATDPETLAAQLEGG